MKHVSKYTNFHFKCIVDRKIAVILPLPLKLFHNTWQAPQLGFRDRVNSPTVYQWQWICSMICVGDSVMVYHLWCGASITFLNKLYYKVNDYCLRPRKWDATKTYFGSSLAAVKHLSGGGRGNSGTNNTITASVRWLEPAESSIIHLIQLLTNPYIKITARGPPFPDKVVSCQSEPLLKDKYQLTTKLTEKYANDSNPMFMKQ